MVPITKLEVYYIVSQLKILLICKLVLVPSEEDQIKMAEVASIVDFVYKTEIS